jgi:hypothetical protein
MRLYYGEHALRKVLFVISPFENQKKAFLKYQRRLSGSDQRHPYPVTSPDYSQH